MFSMLPLSPEQVLELRSDHGIYMAGSGRFNVVGLSDDNVDRFAAAVVEKLEWLSAVRERKSKAAAASRESPTSTGGGSPISSRSAARWTGSRRRSSSRSASSATSSARAATTWRKSCSARRLTHRHDAACGYYRSRPLLLALGVPLEDALGSGMAREGGYSDGRDIGAVFNYPNPDGTPALADVRRRRRAIYADRGLGAGDRLSSRRARRQA